MEPGSPVPAPGRTVQQRDFGSWSPPTAAKGRPRPAWHVITPSKAGTVKIDGFKTAGTLEAYVAQGDSLDDVSAAYNGNEDPPIDLSTVAPLVTTGITETFTYTFPAYSVTSLTVQGCHLADIDGDGDVDVGDIMLVAACWHCEYGDACYDLRYDLNGNGNIDIVDIMLVAVHWGEGCE